MNDWKNKPLLAALALSGLAANLSAVDITWIGINNSETNSSADVSDTLNWDTGAVPGIGDTAIFIFRGTPNLEGDISITTADTEFDPSRIQFDGNAAPNSFQQDADIIIDKDLNLTGGLYFSGYPSASSGRDNNRLQFGVNQLATTITVNGSIDVSAAGWNFLRLGIGNSSPGNATTLNMTGDITFNAPLKNASINSDVVEIENDTNDLSPLLSVSTPSATITMDAATNGNTFGVIPLGYTRLAARSDQTWNADPLSFVTMNGTIGSASGPGGKFLVESIDGGRLDNLGGLNIRTNGGNAQSGNDTNGMRVYGGTYGSLWMHSVGSSGRSQQVNQTDHVAYQAQTVEFDGSNDPFQSGYGLVLENAETNSDTQVYNTAGFNLDVTAGVKLIDSASVGIAPARPLRIDAEGSTVTIGGDLLMDAPNRGPEQAFLGNTVQNQMGIDGGASGMTLTIGGSFDTRVVSYTGRDNWINSNVTFTGDANTIEVGDASSTTGLVTGSYGIGTLNIGGVADAAGIQLVNDYLNNNPATTGVGSTDKIGEKLIAGNLNIAANSTLDVNGQNVEIVTSLALDATATLDLNTGTVLSDGTIVESFFGLGDQVSSWSAFESQVIDSSNPLYAFSAILDGGNTKWQASLVPEPSTYALAFAAIMGIVVLVRRRR